VSNGNSEQDKAEAKQRQNALRKSLNLPKTAFSMKANLAQMEPRMQKRWDGMGLYERLQASAHPAGPFVIHDGPPYANGNIHMGHLLNKVLKDIVVRSKTMAGHEVAFVPGWDCHGLPIEHQVMKKLGPKARDMVTGQIRKRCQDYAEGFIKTQRKQMQRLGTVGAYDDPYLTMRPQYEADTLEVFAKLVERGLIYRALKPVHWSIANETALADAELEYQDREDTSIYVRFVVTAGDSGSERSPGAAAMMPGSLNAKPGDVSLLIWTTTPWTLPANLAVAVNARETYGLYAFTKDGEQHQVVLVTALAAKVLAAGSIEDAACLGTCSGQELVDSSLTYQHPFLDRMGRVVAADYVTTEDGTGLVHTAPGHGAEDYITGLREGLDVYCPVKADGTFDETAPEWLRGIDVWSGNDKVVEHLKQSGHLFLANRFVHSYPHDWRSKTPTIFRATEQWFVAVDKPGDGLGKSLREMALDAVDHDVNFVPDWGHSRMRGMLEGRPDWCISRQRSWGLPIVAFLRDGFEPLVSPASIRCVAEKVRSQGSNIWFSSEPEALLEGYDPADDAQAPAWLREAGSAGLKLLSKSRDIFDVWFESGSSWNAVLRARGLGYPADLYLEGSDQHRGWFQLSLLPSLGAHGQAPFKSVVTHGFIVDADGKKMSKSGGNALSVDDLLAQYGADVCRWWVGSLNVSNDIKVDWSFFKTASDEYRKIRNTIRFCLGNIPSEAEATGAQGAVPPYTFSNADASSVDAWVLGQFDELVREVKQAYDAFAYRRVRNALFNFCNDTLSAVYLAAIKDRLYCDATDGERRRRTQATLRIIVDGLIRLCAPILVHTAEEAFLSLQGKASDDATVTVHEKLFPEPCGGPVAETWPLALELRGVALKALEDARATDGGLQNPLDAGLRAAVPTALAQALSVHADDLADLCGVSRFEVVAESDAGLADVSDEATAASSDAGLKALQGARVEVVDLRDEPRCERSWKRDGTVKERSGGYLLSDRDAAVMGLA